MKRPLVPELHDIGKLCFVNDDLAEELGLEPGILHSGHKMRLLPSRLGLDDPVTNTWKGIVGHHGVKATQDLEILMLVVADHAGSSLSREPEKTKRLTKSGERYLSIYKLWNPSDRKHLTLLTSRDDMVGLTRWLHTDPDSDELFQRYGPLLHVRPEELTPPMDTVSLASHVTVVGKIYRFLTERLDVYGKATGVKDVESKALDIVKARIGFAQQIVRTRDMSLFDSLGYEIEKLTSDDRVLIATFNEILSILGPDERVEDLLGPLVDAGFSVYWERARTEVGHLESTPSGLRTKEASKLKQASIKVPEHHRQQWFWENLDRKYSRGILAELPKECFAPPICDLCQMEQATISWPDDPQSPGPRENLGPRCYKLRQNASRLFKLDRWTESPTNRVAWIYVGLDLDRLVSFLRPLYQKYAQDVGWPQEEAAQLEVRPTLLLEFQKDYRRFLADFAMSVEEHLGSDNLEHVGGETDEAANSLLCARLENIQQVPSLLGHYLEAVKRYFPVALQRDSALNTGFIVPIRLAVSVSGVKFPFSEHWRIIQEGASDVLVNVIGKGQMCASLTSLPILIEAGKPSRRSALHNLAEVAKISEALARVYAEDKEHYQEYRPLLEQMQPLGMTYESLLAYAKMLED